MSCPFGYSSQTPPTSVRSPPIGSSEDPQRFSVLGFETVVDEGESFSNRKRERLCNYTDYIQTEHLLELQEGESIMKPDGKGMMHHDELLFIVTHQSIELWFKVLLKDLHKARELMQDGALPCEDTQGFASWRSLELVGKYLRRGTMIFHHAADTFKVLQTMHPADFLEFRDFLVPASGFQSFQFRQIEILMGLDEKERAMCNDAHVFTALHQEQRAQCETLLTKSVSLKTTVEELLAKVQMPASFMEHFYKATEELHVMRQTQLAHHSEETARHLAQEAMLQIKGVVEAPNAMLPADHPEQKRLQRVVESALYVSSYRDAHPHFAVLSGVLDELIALEEGLLLFRARHMHNVERIIGRRVGTGGSSGVEYLDKTRTYRIFLPLWALRQIFIRSSMLPSITELHSVEKIADITLFRDAPNH